MLECYTLYFITLYFFYPGTFYFFRCDYAIMRLCDYAIMRLCERDKIRDTCTRRTPGACRPSRCPSGTSGSEGECTCASTSPPRAAAPAA